MGNSIFNVENTYSIFLPKDYLDFKYMHNCTADYMDLYKVPQLIAGNTYEYIRVYTNREGFVQERINTTSNYYTTTTLTEVNVSNSFFARQDADEICITSFFFLLVIILIFNTITEFISRGGLFKWS